MRLSMHILADWLKKYNPQPRIYEGKRVIRNVRPLTENSRSSENNVYVSRVTSDSSGTGVVCIHGNDTLVLNTDDTEQVVNDIMDAFDHYNSCSDKLMQQLPSITLDDILQESCKLIDCYLTVGDSSHRVLSSAPTDHALIPTLRAANLLEGGGLQADYIMQVESDNRFRKFSKAAYIYEMNLTSGDQYISMVRNLFSGGSQWGWLTGGAFSCTQGMLDVFDELGDILEQWILFHEDYQNKWERSGVFLEILDHSFSSRDSVRNKLWQLGWEEDEEKSVYIIRSVHSNEICAPALKRRIEVLSDRVYTLSYKDTLTSIYCGTREGKEVFEAKLIASLQPQFRCGVSPAFRDIFSLPHYWQLATAAIDCSSQEVLFCRYTDAALAHSICLLAEHTQGEMVHPSIQLLKRFDRENNSEYCLTLEMFLRMERSHLKTSNILHLHRNTLLYRIKRIEEITGLDLDDPELRLHLQLSLAVIKNSN